MYMPHGFDRLCDNTMKTLSIKLELHCTDVHGIYPSNLQMALLSVEMCSLQEESERMRAMAEVREPSEQLQSAIKDRDDAIAK